ncbi:AbiA family abortive infection protein [Oceanobacillus bengalensis]|uniref:AbiA family abortive infection protein n=1 Tax=Oceanobacillus bengalensis TaxID=1435466 RepID=A0A494YY77_9BACI|nr:AbiA family abortive infection protein [Oceanobacillus bengalensis]RKQ15176.1 AbiA family abortive infection protein [Oceanobacillus bengalensis]
MINMEYDTWNNVCEGIFKQSKQSLNKYLQLYPFSILTDDEKELIKSEEFFYKFIHNGALFKNKLVFDFPKHYIQKNNSSFRNSKLVSPIIYVYMECIGYHVCKAYTKDSNTTRCYYAGNIQELDFHYKKSYERYYADINESSQRFQYYYKLDVTNFFDSLDINILFDLINKKSTIIDSRTALVYKRLLQSIGNGKYPTIEKSCSLSFLATNVYLDLFDSKLEGFLGNLHEIEDFQIIRYVDDLFIFFNTSDDLLNEAVSIIKNFVIHNYREIGLNLNEQKSNYGVSEDISEELSAALYNHYVNEQDIDISSMFDENNMKVFVDKLYDIARERSHNHDRYKEIKDEVFSISGVQYSSDEVFRYLIYYRKGIFNDAELISKLKRLLRRDYKIIKYDTKNLINMILNTSDGDLIRFFLNEIFRNDNLDSFDIAMIINYLILRNFQHQDLLNKLAEYEPNIYKYINMYCKNSFVESLIEEGNNGYINLILEDHYDFNNDLKVWYIYFMYRHYKNSNDILESFSYYKSYFDRVTALLMHFKGIEQTGKGKPNYKMYYKQGPIIKSYKRIKFNQEITNIEDLIEKAHDLRNHNPINHSSAEVMDDETLNIEEIENIIIELEFLLEQGFSGEVINE